MLHAHCLLLNSALKVRDQVSVISQNKYLCTMIPAVLCVYYVLKTGTSAIIISDSIFECSATRHKTLPSAL